jgi:hypothetical protein
MAEPHSHAHHDHGGTPPEHQPAPGSDIHGMLVVGERSIYLSHLPMFSHPHHRFQAIMEATFTDPSDRSRDLGAAYVSDRRSAPERFYTLEPELFVLTELAPSGSGQPPQRRQFLAKLSAGHFERGGRFLFHTSVDVTDVIHFRQLDPGGGPLGQLQYLMFGAGEELFLAHLISAPPDFDQVLPVKLAGAAPGNGRPLRGARVIVRDRANTIGDRLRENETVAADLQLAGESADQGIEVQLEAGRECYLEEGELRVPAEFDQTEEERSAGF